MTPQEFATTIRNKYPNGVALDGTSYAEMDDTELSRRIVEKYPVYKSKVQLDSYSSAGSVVGTLGGAVSELGSSVQEAVNERAGNIKEEFGKAVSSTEKVSDKQSARSALHTLGEGAGLVGDITFEGLKFLTPKFVEDLVGKGAEKVGETEVAQALATKYAELQEKHPEAMKDVESVINIASLIPVGKGTQVAGKGISKATSQVSRMTGEALDARRLARVGVAKNEIDEVVGSIVQGSKGDIARAKKALSTIDTTDVKTYADLKAKIDDGVEALATKVDENLEAAGESIGPLRIKDLNTRTRVGTTTVDQNFVDDALEQLDELYTKINDAPARVKIQDLKARMSEEGLSLKELNDLSRQYGREFKSKAFSKTGDALTSVNAQAFENTRKGIKNVVRSKIPDDATKMLDERMSEMLNTERLVGKMDEKVNALYQKAKKRGVFENIARKAADVVDIATLGTVSGFISRLLPSNVGLKVMNSIDLENALAKNLKKLDKLLRISDDKTLVDEVSKLLKENNAKTK